MLGDNLTFLRWYSMVFWIVCAGLGLTLLSCSSSDLTQNLSAEERFAVGKTKFDNGDYLEAISEFEIVKLQFPGSAVADDAQFYLAECRFKREEYLLGAEEFHSLKRNMPTSPLVPTAQFNIAMCYYNLAPKSSLDQKYTYRAIDEFQTFIEYYPTDQSTPEADAKIRELNARLAKKDFDTAELYMKMEVFKAATAYYTSVVEKFHDTQYAEPALLGKVKSLVARKKYEEAKQDADKFIEKYPQSRFREEINSLRQSIEERLRSKTDKLSTQQKRSQRP